MENEFALEKNQAHVWYAELNRSDSEILQLLDLLSEDEKQRAARFHFEKDRNHFIAARGLLRQILSHYISVTPRAIHFFYGSHGKPELDPTYNLRFNVSHSHDMALFAVTREIAVGVDIERMDRQCDIDGIVERFFSQHEYAVIKNLSGTKKIQAFFNGWARKEAFLKALGEGLSYPLANVEVTLAADEPARFLALHDKNLSLVEWHLHALDVVENYSAALVIRGNLGNVKTRIWN